MNEVLLMEPAKELPNRPVMISKKRVAHLECLFDCSNQRGVLRFLCNAQCVDKGIMEKEQIGTLGAVEKEKI